MICKKYNDILIVVFYMLSISLIVNVLVYYSYENMLSILDRYASPVTISESKMLEYKKEYERLAILYPYKDNK